MPKERQPCSMCGRYEYTERHHIFGGANRKFSEQDGLVVDLCHKCHNEPPNGVHFNKKRMEYLHKYGQNKWEILAMRNGMTEADARQAFMKRYGRSYL